MKFTTSFFFLTCFLIFSCKKDDNPSKMSCGNPHTSYITSADLINCKYKTGTYWVYIDSISMLTDSSRVVDYNQGSVFDQCQTTFETHAYNVMTYPSILRRYVVVAGGLFKDFEGSANSGVQIYDDYASALTSNETRFDSLFVYDQYYYKVLRTEIANDKTEVNNRSVYYVNSDYGLLKHEIYQGSTLISKKILKNKQIIR